MTLLRKILWLAFTCLALQPAAAEKLTAAVEPRRVLVDYNYEGSSLFIVGAIDGRAATSLLYDIAITVTGPSQAVTTWEKKRVAGIWVNKKINTYYDIPSLLGVYTNRPLQEFGSASLLRQQKLGLENFLVVTYGFNEKNDDLRKLIKTRTESEDYREDAKAITFLTPKVFRADIPLPATVLAGNYKIELQLFRDGIELDKDSLSFVVTKTGFEHFVVNAAVQHSFYYGLAAVLAALSTGWLANVAFRRN
jgi:uncharacterized protein (TIGR02186 family)